MLLTSLTLGIPARRTTCCERERAAGLLRQQRCFHCLRSKSCKGSLGMSSFRRLATMLWCEQRQEA